MVKLTKNMMVIDLMRTTGWSRDRALAAIEELEATSLIQFSHQGGMKLCINAEVF
ncbi:hypothetical protein SA27298_1511 [Streptococcus anginosus]|nr:hypothetical protein SA27298_1425 [Streptococcus anginosus]BBD42966.1 hypothetical protein SA27298_1511 [Streptococcus anginosus]